MRGEFERAVLSPPGMPFVGAGMKRGIGLLDKLAADSNSAVYSEVVRPLLAMCEGSSTEMWQP